MWLQDLKLANHKSEKMKSILELSGDWLAFNKLIYYMIVASSSGGIRAGKEDDNFQESDISLFEDSLGDKDEKEEVRHY